MTDEEKDIVVGVDVMGHILGLSRQSIQAHAKQRGLPRAGHGQYNVADVVQWYIREVLSGDDTIQEEKRKLVIAQRRRTELDVLQRRSELITHDRYMADIFDIAGIIAGIDTVARRIGADIGLNDEGIKTLTQELRRFRDRVAGAIEALADPARSGGADSQPADGERRRVGRPKSATAKRRPRARAVADKPSPVLE